MERSLETSSLHGNDKVYYPGADAESSAGYVQSGSFSSLNTLQTERAVRSPNSDDFCSIFLPELPETPRGFPSSHAAPMVSSSSTVFLRQTAGIAATARIPPPTGIRNSSRNSWEEERRQLAMLEAELACICEDLERREPECSVFSMAVPCPQTPQQLPQIAERGSLSFSSSRPSSGSSCGPLSTNSKASEGVCSRLRLEPVAYSTHRLQKLNLQDQKDRQQVASFEVPRGMVLAPTEDGQYLSPLQCIQSCAAGLRQALAMHLFCDRCQVSAGVKQADASVLKVRCGECQDMRKMQDNLLRRARAGGA